MQQKQKWEFLKFKTVELTDDAISKETSSKERPHWEAKMVRELLNKITPPEMHTAKQKKYMRMVSEERTTRNEVKKLGKLLTLILEKCNFPENGICEPRHDMYSELFDELIRQVIVDFPELGSILLQIGDHLRLEVWNFEQMYVASQAYGYRMIYMENADVRLNELEAEHKQLLERQENAAQEVERIHKENLEKEAEINNIVTDGHMYSNEVEFYYNYIQSLLYYFDLQAQDVIDKKLLIRVQEEVEAEEESLSFEVEESSEEEDDLPIVSKVDEEIKVELSKTKEDISDKSVVYRGNEEEVFDSDSDTKKSIIFETIESSKTEDDTIPDGDSHIFEKLDNLYQENLNYDATISDAERGYIKKTADAYEEETKIAEEEKLKQDKLQEDKIKQNQSIQKVFVEEIEEERMREEYMEEEEIEEKEEEVDEEEGGVKEIDRSL